MLKKLIVSISICTLCLGLKLAADQAEPEPEYDSCTSIMVGKEASDDGSVMTAHTCDSNYRTWIDFVDAKKHRKGDKTEIFKGTMHNFFSGDLRGIEKTGEIPQVENTYRYLYTAYPVMNQYQLGM